MLPQLLQYHNNVRLRWREFNTTLHLHSLPSCFYIRDFCPLPIYFQILFAILDAYVRIQMSLFFVLSTLKELSHDSRRENKQHLADTNRVVKKRKSDIAIKKL